MTYETGKIGLSEPEITAEKQAINDNICQKHGVPFGYFYLKTPQEIHRCAVLDAMSMANSYIIYNDFGGWERKKDDFTRPWDASGAKEPKFAGTEEQRQAHALSYAELSSIWTAQCARVAKAKIYRSLVPDTEEGGPYHGVKW